MVDVSVVVIVYNDQDRLPTAVRSVLEQTLRGVEVVIVDDHSADRSFAVARRLAARHPDRVRAFRLPRNSGGCGRPRDHGVERSAGRYVMFLDSDDELDRDACRNMVRAAETTGADLVSGLCVRVLETGRGREEKPWYRWIYRGTRVLDSITDFPEPLVWDTLATNKCYRRSFLVEHGLRFPTGVAYEDLLFSARAYLAARRITLIPNRVYRWHVHQGPRVRSITQRRGEIRNLADRLAMHRRIDALLAERGLDEIRFAKDVKFLKHDLLLHLRDLPLRDEAYRRAFTGLVRDYVADFSAAAYRRLAPPQAVCAYLLSRGDLDALLPAVDALANGHKTAAALVEREGRVYWNAEHLDDPLGRELLDVTGLGCHTRPLRRLAPRNAVTGHAVEGGRMKLTGRVVNPLGRIPASSRVRGRLECTARRLGRRTFRFPLRRLVHHGDHLAWTAEVELGRAFHPIGVVDDVWDLRLVLDVDGTRLPTRLTVDTPDLDRTPVPVRPLLPGPAADRVVPEVTAKGHLALRVSASTAAQRRLRAAVTGAATGPAGRRGRALLAAARRAPRTLASEANKRRLYHGVLCRLPKRRGLAVFESHLGRRYADSPRAIYEELRGRGSAITAVWSYDRSPDGFPRDALLVRRWSVRYLLALARAEYWIDNQGFPSGLRKPDHTTYVQTWHGSAFKRMGFDEASVKLRGRQERARLQADLDRFDVFCVRSQHDRDTLVKAFRLAPSVPLSVGYPRNDALVRQREREELTGRRGRPVIAAAPHLPDGRDVLLYAPTFRGRPGRRRARVRPLFDPVAFAREFGDRYVLLVRAHYLERMVLPPSVAGTVIDVSAEHDTTPLLAAADALITDYSSVMFDYVLLDRPMVYYVPDHDDYVRTRGTYLDLEEVAPGPLARTEEELFTAIRELKTVEADHAEARRAFAARFAAHDTGTAARAVVDRFLAPEGRG